MTNVVHDLYGNRLRVRACGILVENDGILMVNHRSLTATDFWAPPGGGVEFGEPARRCLEREFHEETGLDAEVGEFLFACELVQPPLHAVELFFMVTSAGGRPTTGRDPEMGTDQIIKSVQFLSWSAIRSMDPSTLHGLFRLAEEPAQITRLRGYFSL